MPFLNRATIASVAILVTLLCASAGRGQEQPEFAVFAGRVEAKEVAEIRSRATGYLAKVLFTEGAQVKEGELLFEIDAAIYEADLKRIQGEVTLLTARRQLAADRHAIFKPLFDKGAISREEFAKVEGELAETTARLAAAKGAMGTAELNLGFTKIAAPISGRIGRSLVTRGNLIKADDTSPAMLLTTIVSVTPVYVFLDMDERTLLRLVRHAKDRKLTDLPVAMSLADEKDFARQGKIDFVDNSLNPKTGTLRVRAVFANSDGLLLPGMSAKVRVPLR